jgi:murein L,D-transpeptidase YcbB/YkuD
MSSFFDAALARSVRSFQVDQGLPETGVPDEATLRALTELETRMSAADATEEKAPDR